MNLPSFLWLWRIAAWSMGLSWLAFFILTVSGGWMWWLRRSRQPRPDWARPFHYGMGVILSVLVLILLAIGIVGTLGHYGSLGHSVHLYAGLGVVDLVFLSAWSAVQIRPDRPWARRLHLGINAVLLLGFIVVSWTGWEVVQKYLP
jgi:TRAP-type C4-dicarboxylate transport system permease small subunit